MNWLNSTNERETNLRIEDFITLFQDQISSFIEICATIENVILLAHVLQIHIRAKVFHLFSRYFHVRKFISYACFYTRCFVLLVLVC